MPLAISRNDNLVAGMNLLIRHGRDFQRFDHVWDGIAFNEYDVFVRGCRERFCHKCLARVSAYRHWATAAEDIRTPHRRSNQGKTQKEVSRMPSRMAARRRYKPAVQRFFLTLSESSPINYYFN